MRFQPLFGNDKECAELARALGISDPETVSRFVLDIEVGEVAKLYVERYADQRGLKVLKALAPRVKIVERSPFMPAGYEACNGRHCSDPNCQAPVAVQAPLRPNPPITPSDHLKVRF